MNDSSLGDKKYADDLTWREQDVLLLLSERLTNREIADRLHLAESTVKDYVGKILSKLYVNNRREAVERGKELGLLEAPQKLVDRPPSHLPSETTPFVGRSIELEEINNQLAQARLLTLLGPGGIGKTRLALKVAQGAAGSFTDGVFFVSLAPIHSAEHIIQTTAEALRFPLATDEDPQHQLLRYLRQRQLLLVMDNFEHILEGAGIISEILKTAPQVKLLVTSRERLNLQSEVVLNVGGLTFPEQLDSADVFTYDAINLFNQSAGRVRPGFEPTSDDLKLIANICQIVQGMPLAIELAAAWLHILDLSEVAGELEKDLDILAADVRDAPSRHRSIRAVFEQSWSMLGEKEQEVFMQLSVFRGGFTREAAQQVAGASLPQMAELANKSFLSHEPKSGRLRIHELLRQYAQEQLEITPQTTELAQEAHAEYYASFFQEKGRQLRGSRQMQALVEIEADIENVRASWRYYLVQRNISQLWRFIYSLWHLHWIKWWNHAGMMLFSEAVRELEGEKGEEAEAFRALASGCQAYFMAWLGLADQAYALAENSVHSLKSLSHPRALVLAYDSLVVNAYMSHRFSDLIKETEILLQLAYEVGDKWLLTFVLFGNSMRLFLMGEYTEAKECAEANLALSNEIGDVIGSSMPLILLGHAALVHGDLDDAAEQYHKSLRIAEQSGYYYSIQTASKYLGRVSTSLGYLEEAERNLSKCLTVTKEVGFERDVIVLLYEFSRLRAAQDDSERAVELLTFVLQHPASDQANWLEGSMRDGVQALLRKLADKMSLETFQSAQAHGRELNFEELVAGLVSQKK